MSLTKIRLGNAWNRGCLSFWGLVTRVCNAINDHDTLNQAAVVAFYAMLSLAPLLSLIFAAALGARGGVALEVRALANEFLPDQARHLVHEQIDKIQSASPVGILSLSAAILLWSASSLFVAVMSATNAAFGVRDSRSWWLQRFIAILLTLVEIVLVIGASVMIVAWPAILDWLKLDSVAAAGATIVQWLVAVVALLAAFEIAYYFAPDVKQEWEWITPGSVLGVLVLIASSIGFRLYLHFGSSYSETYGALAGVVLMMLWLYFAALALLVGAEVNSVIEHAAPVGETPGSL